MRNLKTTRPMASRLFSMHPIRSVKITRTPNARLDHLSAVVDAPGGSFQVELTHPCPPVPGWLYQRQAELDQLSTASASSNWPVLVLGDLNETPFGAGWRELLKTSGLSPIGPLSMPTWPSQLKEFPFHNGWAFGLITCWLARNGRRDLLKLDQSDFRSPTHSGHSLVARLK